MPIKTLDTSTASITYASYLRALACLDTPHNQVIALALPPALLSFVASLRDELLPLARELGASLKDLTKALASRDVFRLLKALRFSFSKLLQGLHALSRLLPDGLLRACTQLSKTPLLDRLRRGLASVDEVLSEYPILKKLTGVALGAFLFWVWLNMSFTGSFTDDFDLSQIGDALSGAYSLEDFLLSPAAIETFVLLGTGLLGFSVPWLGNSLYNLIVALLFTGAKHARNLDLSKQLRPIIKLVRT